MIRGIARISLLCTAIFWVSAPEAAHAFSSKAKSLTEGPGDSSAGQVLLSAVVREKQTGTALDTPEAQKKTAEEVDAMLDFLNRVRKGGTSRAALVQRCEESETASFFCPLLDELESKKPSRRRRVYLNRSTVRAIQRDLIAAKLDRLEKATDSELAAALKRIPETRSLKKVMKAALDAGPCPSTALLSALGMRAELNFPEAEHKQLAVDLYSRAIACGEDISTIRAAYRLGLIRVWEDKCGEVEKIFASVADNPLATDYRQRALYWRFHCAARQGNDRLRDEMQAKLVREFPLSLHALLAGGDHTFADRKILSGGDPLISFRSKTKPEVNAVLAAAEMLQAKSEPQAAADLLDVSYDRFKEAEVPVQLYASVLLMRSGESLRKFKLMASIFHDNPTLISQSTMEMLYPLQRFELIRNHEERIDPYLVISLIRQESAFNPRARSGAGALGLMQLMPRTARRFERVSRRQLLNPEINVRLGVKFFSKLLEKFDGDVELALASYNAGRDRVEDWVARYPVKNRLLFIDMMPFRETREYVASIARNYFWYLRLYDQEAMRTRLPASHPADPTTPAVVQGGSQVPSRFVVFSLWN